MEAEAVQRILSKFNINELNDMQLNMLDKSDGENDIILIAPTGSGKTLAFLLPILSKMAAAKSKGIIIAPSRELVLQIENVSRTMAMGLKITACYGGHSIKMESSNLKSDYELIIGTPGRLADHFRRNNIDGKEFSFCILDEFDKSLEIGFHDEMEEILDNLTNLKRTILTSATEPRKLPAFVNLKSPISIYDKAEKVKSKLMQWKVISPVKDKLTTLQSLTLDLLPASMIVFCNFKESVERVSDFLKENMISNDFFHGGLDQFQRELVLSKFRNGSTKILISTDLAARGLDIPIVENVIHYHLPISEEEFIHRNGRTARMGAKGSSFIIQFEGEELPAYVKVIPDTYYPANKDNEEIQTWVTLKINRGKQDKINKVDVMGFMCKTFDLNKDEVGKIEIKDKISLVAIPTSKSSHILNGLAEVKLKGKSVKLEVI